VLKERLQVARQIDAGIRRARIRIHGKASFPSLCKSTWLALRATRAPGVLCACL
jgi:hypothetical protein